MAFLAFFKSISAETCHFCAFSYRPGGFEGLFDFFDSHHHHPWAGHSPHQQWVPKAVYLHIKFLYIMYYIIYMILYIMLYIIIYIILELPSDYGCGMTQSLPLSYWSPEKAQPPGLGLRARKGDMSLSQNGARKPSLGRV